MVISTTYIKNSVFTIACIGLLFATYSPATATPSEWQQRYWNEECLEGCCNNALGVTSCYHGLQLMSFCALSNHVRLEEHTLEWVLENLSISICSCIWRYTRMRRQRIIDTFAYRQNPLTPAQQQTRASLCSKICPLLTRLGLSQAHKELFKECLDCCCTESLYLIAAGNAMEAAFLSIVPEHFHSHWVCRDIVICVAALLWLTDRLEQYTELELVQPRVIPPAPTESMNNGTASRNRRVPYSQFSSWDRVTQLQRQEHEQ